MSSHVKAQGATPADQNQIKLGKTIYQRGVTGKDIPSCAACHGLGGEGNGPMAIPVLAGQHAAYVVTQLQQFASGARQNSPGHIMHTIARAMNATQEAAVAAYVQQLNPGNTLGIGPKDFSTYAKTLGSHDTADRSTSGPPKTGKAAPAAAGGAAHSGPAH